MGETTWGLQEVLYEEKRLYLLHALAFVWVS
jgi:hypothetical protein